MIVRILKNIWPRLVMRRATVNRARYRTLPDGTLRTLSTNQVRLLP